MTDEERRRHNAEIDAADIAAGRDIEHCEPCGYKGDVVDMVTWAGSSMDPSPVCVFHKTHSWSSRRPADWVAPPPQLTYVELALRVRTLTAQRDEAERGVLRLADECRKLAAERDALLADRDAWRTRCLDTTPTEQETTR